MNACLHDVSFFHFVQLGRNLRRKHSSQSSALSFGRFASKSRNDGDARLRISIQFCRGTHCRTDRFLRSSSYPEERRARKMGRRQGLSWRSEAMDRHLDESWDMTMREGRSSSPMMSAINSTGRASMMKTSRNAGYSVRARGQCEATRTSQDRGDDARFLTPHATQNRTTYRGETLVALDASRS